MRPLVSYFRLNLHNSPLNLDYSQLNLKGREPFDVMTVLLAGDIGGTKTILRLVGTDQGNPLYEMRYSSHQFSHLVPLVETFLAAAADQLGQVYQPEKACFAIAGPVVNETSKLTNLGWQLASDCLSQDLAIAKVSLINDFAAVGYGVLGLAPTDCETLQSGEPQTQAPIAVLGAGTGLGQGFLIHTQSGYQVFASEGGHADFAPRSELEYQLLRYLLDKHDIGRISVERIVSGQGVVAIYQFLRDRDYAKVSPEVEDVVHQWECQVGRSEKTVDAAAAIALAALAGRDRLSEQALQIFVEAYGAEAGNLALKLLPYGGIYVAGGIAAKILPLIKAGGFLSAFTNKGRMRPLLERIPVHIVLNPQVGLIGAALYAAQL
jgi:glucokinase